MQWAGFGFSLHGQLEIRNIKSLQEILRFSDVLLPPSLEILDGSALIPSGRFFHYSVVPSLHRPSHLLSCWRLDLCSPSLSVRFCL